MSPYDENWLGVCDSPVKRPGLSLAEFKFLLKSKTWNYQKIHNLRTLRRMLIL